MDFLKIPALATKAGEIHSLESIPGLHKHLKIRALIGIQAAKWHRIPDP
jgi:hypothetical protein